MFEYTDVQVISDESRAVVSTSATAKLVLAVDLHILRLNTEKNSTNIIGDKNAT